MKTLPCDSVLSSQSTWTLSVYNANNNDCVYCPSDSLKHSHALSDDESFAETHSHSSGFSDHEVFSDEEEEVTENQQPAAPSMREQSPIDICEASCTVVSTPRFADRVWISSFKCDGELHYSGHGFSVHWTSSIKNTLVLHGKVYSAVHFHFHTPSEHTLDGDHEEMELHLVHQAPDGSIAVVGVFFREGDENAFLAQFWDQLAPLQVGEPKTVPLGPIDPSPLALLSSSFFRYRGSLTTPPYTEGVEWIVIRQVAEASREQLDAFRNVLPKPNARRVQALNKRGVSLV